MGFLYTKMIQHFQEIAGESVEIQGAVIIVTQAIAAGVPRDGVVVGCEGFHLPRPVGAVASNAVHQNQQFAFACVVDADGWVGEDAFGYDLRHGAVPLSNALSREAARQRVDDEFLTNPEYRDDSETGCEYGCGVGQALGFLQKKP